MGLGKDDLKQISNLIGLLQKKVTFKDLSGPEVLTVALVFQWIGELKEKIEKSLEVAPKEEVKEKEPELKSVTKEVKKKK